MSESCQVQIRSREGAPRVLGGVSIVRTLRVRVSQHLAGEIHRDRLAVGAARTMLERGGVKIAVIGIDAIVEGDAAAIYVVDAMSGRRYRLVEGE